MSGIPVGVLLVRLSSALHTVALLLQDGQIERAAEELKIAREMLADIQKGA